MDGQTRSYRVFAPMTLDRRRASPLVLVLHGGGARAESMVETTQLDLEATANRFIVAYPQGLDGMWNAGFCCGRASVSGVDDVGFLRRLMDRLGADYRVDPARVYVVGVSNGAMMAYRLACELADRIAGVGSVAGAMLVEGCHPSRPVSVIEIHGTADPLVPYQGGPVLPEDALATQPVPPTMAVAQRWASIDGCRATPEIHREGLVSSSTWTQCADGTAVRLLSIEGGGHTWFAPGFGAANGAVDATRVIWDFFANV